MTWRFICWVVSWDETKIIVLGANYEHLTVRAYSDNQGEKWLFVWKYQWQLLKSLAEVML